MQMPLFKPQTEWLPPEEFPDLIKKGSGSVIGNGEVIGIAVATKHYKGYFPIAHEGGGNMDST